MSNDREVTFHSSVPVFAGNSKKDAVNGCARLAFFIPFFKIPLALQIFTKHEGDIMEKCKIIDTVGTIAAGIGLLLCSTAGFSRLLGTFYLAGFQSITLFTAGTAFLILAVLLKMQVLIEMSRQV